MAPNSTIIQITASTHFPIKLTPTNFPVWRKQIESTLIGLDLDCFLTEANPPKKIIAGKDGPTSNPEYLPWYRQDQVIISAILGRLSDPIQPLISSAVTAHDAWVRLNSSFASASRSRIISLKSKLVKNPKGVFGTETWEERNGIDKDVSCLVDSRNSIQRNKPILIP